MKKLGRIHKKRGFTLIEMVIVLIIMWILLMATMVLSWDQIQKIKDKTVKESILAEMQSRYSRNLWSSSFAWVMYKRLDVTFSWWSNEIIFEYFDEKSEDMEKEKPIIVNNFVDNFDIKYIGTNIDFNNISGNENIENITLQYNPYKISCNILDWDDENKNVVILIRVNDSRDYCFEIKQKNCRRTEVSEEKCNHLKNLVN